MVVDQATLEGVGFGSAVLGCFLRTMLPYLQKLRAAEEENKPPFQRQYWFTMAVSIITSVAAVSLGWASLAGGLNPNASLLTIFILSAGFGWGVNDVTNEFIKMKTDKQQATVVKEGSLTQKVLVDRTRTEAEDKDKDKI